MFCSSVMKITGSFDDISDGMKDDIYMRHKIEKNKAVFVTITIAMNGGELEISCLQWLNV